MKYTVVVLAFLLNKVEPVQGSYLTEFAQLFSRITDSPIAEDEEPTLPVADAPAAIPGAGVPEAPAAISDSSIPEAPVSNVTEDASSTTKEEEQKKKAKEAETPEGKAEQKALKSVNSTKVSPDDIEAAKTALTDTQAEQSQKIADALLAVEETNASIDTLSGDNNYTVPEFKSNMTQSKWNLFNVTDQLQKYRDVVYERNQLQDKQTKQDVQRKLLEQKISDLQSSLDGKLSKMTDLSTEITKAAEDAVAKKKDEAISEEA